MGCLAAVATAVALFFAPVSSAAIYWGDGGAVGGANLDGSGANPDYFQFHHPALFLCDLAVSDTHLYLGGWFGIWRVNLDGPAAPVEIVPGLNNPCGIAIDATHVYWVHRPDPNNQGIGIGRAALDGSGRVDTLISGLQSVCEVAVDGNFIYWVGWGGIGRARLDGSGVEKGFIPTAPGGCGLAVDSGYVYWSSGEAGIGRASLDGIQVDPAFIRGDGSRSSVSSIAVAAAGLYWAEWHEGMVYSSIGRATLGLTPIRNWIPTSVFNIGGVAVDSRPSPPPLPLPSRPFYIGKLRQNLRDGSAVLPLSVPERGDLVVTAPKLGWKLDKGPEPPPWRGGSFSWRLKVWPGPGGGAAKRIRTQLRNRGWARVALRLSYNETGQLPVTKVRRIVLRKRTKPPRTAR